MNVCGVWPLNKGPHFDPKCLRAINPRGTGFSVSPIFYMNIGDTACTWKLINKHPGTATR
ncbi:hypothetical protein AG1IA_08101 [Rhizoctonia solani AG-1 IA]|uniref:Uncharacterized protein n=1 Tax=Thanatephorus cucumeris (strain AG1-IA) TaxID=983506 RepID=L8WM30_THACA|nr:hypothetical protein AG1IA_08101 [Rhizoctonia solani AG-1 IA]